MRGAAPPLRFLLLVLGGWACGRAMFLAPGLLTESAEAEPANKPGQVRVASVQPITRLPDTSAARSRASAMPLFVMPDLIRHPPVLSRPQPYGVASRLIQDSEPVELAAVVASAMLPRSGPRTLPTPPFTAPPAQPFSGPATLSSPALNRWSLSTWALIRRGEGTQLASGGTLGGSQIGARATYSLTRRVALSARMSAPISDLGGAEAAIGIEAQPIPDLPIRVLAERRQRIGSTGRSAFALLGYGGIGERPLIGPVLVEGYAQAGVVGLQSRDMFADGALRLGIGVADDLTVGVGGWGAIQPGASRLDIGPQASYRLPVAGGRMRATAEWRVRVAGDAQPGSGPALTLSTDF